MTWPEASGLFLNCSNNEMVGTFPPYLWNPRKIAEALQNTSLTTGIIARCGIFLLGIQMSTISFHFYSFHTTRIASGISVLLPIPDSESFWLIHSP